MGSSHVTPAFEHVCKKYLLNILTTSSSISSGDDEEARAHTVGLGIVTATTRIS